MERFLEKGHYPSWGVHRQMAPERLQMASSPGRCGLWGTSVVNVEPFPSPTPTPLPTSPIQPPHLRLIPVAPFLTCSTWSGAGCPCLLTFQSAQW